MLPRRRRDRGLIRAGAPPSPAARVARFRKVDVSRPPRIGGCQACIDPYPPRNPRALTPGPEDKEAPMNASWRAPMVSATVSPLLLVASVARANPCPLGMTRLPIFSRRRRSQPTGSAPTMAASSTLVARSRSQTGSESGGSWIVNPGGSLQFDTGGNSGELRPDRHFGLGRVRGTAPFTTRALNRRSAMREVRSSSTSPVRLEGQGSLERTAHCCTVS